MSRFNSPLNPKTKQRRIGLLYVLLASLCFGMMPSVSQIAYNDGLSVETMLAVRFPVALILTWLYIFKKKIPFKLNKEENIFVALLGIIYVGVAICINESYLYLPGAISSIVVFLYISIVVIIEILVGREKPNLMKILCVTLSLMGLILVIWNPEGSGQFRIMGILFALMGGVLYAVYATGLGGNKVKNILPIVIIGYVLIFPTIFNIARCLLSAEPLLPSGTTQIVPVLLLAVFSTFLGNLWFCKAIKLIGSSDAAIINTMEPLIAFFAGMFLMGDKLGISSIFGGILIILAIILLNISQSKTKLNP